MPDVYSQARTLVKAVRESPEWVSLHRLAGPVKSDPAGEKLLAAFRLKRFELQAQALQGQEPSQEQQAAFTQLVQQVQEHKAVREYMEAEQAYSAMLSELQRVLAEVFHPEVPGAVK